MNAGRLRFTDLVAALRATRAGESRAYYVLAARYYLGADRLEELRAHADPVGRIITNRYGEERRMPPVLSNGQVEQIIRDR